MEPGYIADGMYTSITQTEAWLVRETGQEPIIELQESRSQEPRSLPFAQRREASSITSRLFSFGAIFYFCGRKLRKFQQVRALLQRISRRTMFIILVPAYWLIVFRHILGYFDLSLFMFVVGISYVISTIFYDHWGIVQWGMSG